MAISERLFEQTARNEVSERAYVSAITLFTFYGLGLAAIIATMTMDVHLGWGGMLILGLAMPIVGILMALLSEDWPISFIGYNLVIIGLGAITGPTIAMIHTGAVLNALMATAGVTLVMSILGITYPGSLQHWGAWLFAGLLALLFVRLGQVILMSFGVAETLWYIPLVEYFAAVLFSLYIMYDWNRGLSLPRTMYNAVGTALALFLDIINLFITLLRIYADAK